MAYHHIVEMAEDPHLKNRLIGAAAQAGRDDARMWVDTHIFALVRDPAWEAAWAYAEDNKTVNVNQFTGMRVDVINDEMIETAVEAVIGTP